MKPRPGSGYWRKSRSPQGGYRPGPKITPWSSSVVPDSAVASMKTMPAPAEIPTSLSVSAVALGPLWVNYTFRNSTMRLKLRNLSQSPCWKGHSSFSSCINVASTPAKLKPTWNPVSVEMLWVMLHLSLSSASYTCAPMTSPPTSNPAPSLPSPRCTPPQQFSETRRATWLLP